MDISKYFRGFLGLRDNERRLYIFTSFYMHFIFFQMAFREAHCISGKCVALAEKKGVKLSHLSLKHLRTTRYVIKILHFFFLFLAVQNHV